MINKIFSLFQHERSTVKSKNSHSNIFEITDEEIDSVKNNMTDEFISDLTNSIRNLSLNSWQGW